MGRRNADEILSRIDEALAGRRSTQSPLYRWMMTNHDHLSARLASARAEGKLPDWGDLARRFAEFGLTDGMGNAPTASNARQTWWRVQRRHAQLHGSGGRHSTAVPVATPPSDVHGGGLLGSGQGGSLEAVRRQMREKSGRKDRDDG